MSTGLDVVKVVGGGGLARPTKRNKEYRICKFHLIDTPVTVSNHMPPSKVENSVGESRVVFHC